MMRLNGDKDPTWWIDMIIILVIILLVYLLVQKGGPY